MLHVTAYLLDCKRRCRRSGAEHAVWRRPGPARTGVPSARKGPGLWAQDPIVYADIVDQTGEETAGGIVVSNTDV